VPDVDEQELGDSLVLAVQAEGSSRCCLHLDRTGYEPAGLIQVEVRDEVDSTISLGSSYFKPIADQLGDQVVAGR
jgi:hypothetical protein